MRKSEVMNEWRSTGGEEETRKDKKRQEKTKRSLFLALLGVRGMQAKEGCMAWMNGMDEHGLGDMALFLIPRPLLSFSSSSSSSPLAPSVSVCLSVRLSLCLFLSVSCNRTPRMGTNNDMDHNIALPHAHMHCIAPHPCCASLSLSSTPTAEL